MSETKLLIQNLEAKFSTIENLIVENRFLKELKFDSLDTKILRCNTNLIFEKLNESREDLLKRLTESGTGLYGMLVYKNEFTCRKKLDYLTIFNFYTELDFSKFKLVDQELLTVLVLNLDRLFFHFKSKNNSIDYLFITNRHCQTFYESKFHFKHSTFSKYLSNNSIIACCHTDFEQNKHCLRLMDHQLMVKKSRLLGEITNLCLVNDSEIICFRPCEYIILNLSLEVIRNFGQYMNMDWPFYIQSNCILSAVSKDYLFFKISDDYEKKIAIRIVDKLEGKLINVIYIKAIDRFKADYETNLLLVKSAKEPRLNVYEPNEFNLFKKIKIESAQFG
ncbi:hypothetical protein BpHYR1_053498, partial [Brachionus plicatilis]